MASHRALENYDILGEIFQHLAISDVSSGADRATLVRSARVCRAFSEHALNFLWQSLDSLLPALLLLPSFIVTGGRSGMEEDETYTLSRLPSMKEYERFRAYAKRVRSLSASTSRIPSAKGDVLLRLKEFNNGQPLFPSLRELWWYQYSPIDRSMMAVLVPSLEWVLLSFLHSWSRDSLISRDRGDRAQTELMHAIRQTTPSIWRLTVYGRLPAAALTSVLTWDRLRFVDAEIYPGADPPLVKALLSMGSLLRVSFVVGSLASEPGLLPSGFSSLRECALTGTSLDVARALSTVSSLSLRSLDLDIRELPLTLPQASDIQHLLSGVPRFKELREFMFSYGNSPLPDPASLVHCLTTMHSLEKVDINVSQQLPLQESKLLDIARASPSLVDFTYYAAQGNTLSWNIEILTQFVHLCPGLRRLDLPTIDFYIPDALSFETLQPHSLRYLRVSDRVELQRKEEERRLAEVLSSFFPCLDVENPQESYVGDGAKWERVLRHIVRMNARPPDGEMATLPRDGHPSSEQII